MTKKSHSITIRDVARQAGASVATVSRYINHKSPVSDELASRIQQVMDELNYVPLVAARNLATQKTNAIGFVLTYRMYGDFFASLLRGAEDVTGEAKLNLLIESRQPNSNGKVPPVLGPHNTDGLLVFVDSLNDADLAHLSDLNFPVVLIHRSSPAPLKIPSVMVENKAALIKIIDHLIEVHACQRIAFLAGPKGNEDSLWRELGYRESLAAHGLLVDPDLIRLGGFSEEIAQYTVERWLAEGFKADAIFAADDDSAYGALRTLQQAGIRVPEDVPVVGFDDAPTSRLITPSLTTIGAPIEDSGYQSARILGELIRTGQAVPKVLLPTSLVIRRSCGCQV